MLPQVGAHIKAASLDTSGTEPENSLQGQRRDSQSNLIHNQRGNVKFVPWIITKKKKKLISLSDYD